MSNQSLPRLKWQEGGGELRNEMMAKIARYVFLLLPVMTYELVYDLLTSKMLSLLVTGW